MASLGKCSCAARLRRTYTLLSCRIALNNSTGASPRQAIRTRILSIGSAPRIARARSGAISFIATHDRTISFSSRAREIRVSLAVSRLLANFTLSIFTPLYLNGTEREQPTRRRTLCQTKSFHNLLNRNLHKFLAIQTAPRYNAPCKIFANYLQTYHFPF